MQWRREEFLPRRDITPALQTFFLKCYWWSLMVRWGVCEVPIMMLNSVTQNSVTWQLSCIPENFSLCCALFASSYHGKKKSWLPEVTLSLLMALQPFEPGRFFSFLILYAVGRTPWTGNQPVARQLPTHRTTQTRNKRIQTSMPWVEFEPTIPASERAKTVHATDRAVTVFGTRGYWFYIISLIHSFLSLMQRKPFTVCYYSLIAL
jgi:hypothetical protein